MEKIIALGIHLQLSCSDIEEITENDHNDCSFTYGKQEYLVLTDKEADEYERDRVEDIIEDCYLLEYRREEKKSSRSNPLLQYLDLDKWIDDWCGNRGENISGYDGQEHSVKFKDETYYVYRTN